MGTDEGTVVADQSDQNEKGNFANNNNLLTLSQPKIMKKRKKQKCLIKERSEKRD